MTLDTMDGLLQALKRLRVEKGSGAAVWDDQGEPS